VYGAGRVLEADVRAMLGTIDRGHVLRIAECLAAGDGAGLVATLKSLDEQAPDYDQVLAELAGLLERLALVQVVPGAGTAAGLDASLVSTLAARLAPEDVQLYYQIALVGRRDLGLAPEPRVGFEMALLRMLAFRPLPPGAAEAAGGGHAEAPRAAAPAPRAEPARRAAPADRAAAPVPAADAATSWPELLARLDLAGAAHQLAANCVWLGREADTVRFRLDRRSDALRTPQTEERLAQALGRHFGVPVRLVIERDEGPAAAPAAAETPAKLEARAAAAEIAAARVALEVEPTVLALKERFGASVAPDTIKPNR
jgi:DNA polymerase-3 subunit gamma/tau